MFSFLEAVRLRFSFKDEDMNNVWSSIRTSLVQKVTDIRKESKRRNQSKEATSSQQAV